MARWDAYRLIAPPGSTKVRQVHLGIVYAPTYQGALRKTINRFKIKTFDGRYNHVKLVLRASDVAVQNRAMNQTVANNVEKLAKGLAAFAEECGLPNGISPGELSDRYTVLSPRYIGLYLIKRMEDLQEQLAKHQIKIVSYQEQEGYGKRIRIASCAHELSESDVS